MAYVPAPTITRAHAPSTFWRPSWHWLEDQIPFFSSLNWIYKLCRLLYVLLTLPLWTLLVVVSHLAIPDHLPSGCLSSWTLTQRIMIPFAARLVWCATFGGVGMFPFGIDVMDWLPLNMWKGYTCAHEVAPIAEEKWYQGDATDPEGIITPKAVDLYWIKPDPAVWGTWPPCSPTAPEVILVVFGGGYIQGHPLEGDRCHEIARLTGITVLTFKYRTAIRISGAFPAALQDIITAYAFLMSRGVKRLAIIGDSAGAGLSLALLQHFSCLASSGTPFPPPSRLEPPSHMILYSPWVDLTLSSPSIQSNAQYDVLLPTMLAPAVWLYSAAARSCKVPTGPNSVQNIGLHHPLLSPALDSSVDSLKRVAEWSIPEILVSWGSVEILDDEIMQLCENFQKAGFGEHVKQHRWDGEVHVFQVIPSIFSQKRKEALAESVEFLLLGAGGGSDLKESLPGSKHQIRDRVGQWLDPL